MTIIVGAIKGASVWVGGDRQTTSGSTIVPASGSKLWRQGAFVFGSTGSPRESQIIEHATTLPKPPTDPDDVIPWLVVDVVNLIRSARKESGYDEKEKTGTELGPILMMGLRGRLFVIYQDYQVDEFDDYAAVGCGTNCALGSLATTRGMRWSAKRRVLSALEATCAHDAYCSGPFDILQARR